MGILTFLGRTIRVAARTPVDLLRGDAARGDRIIRIGSFCKKIAATADERIDTERAIEKMALFDGNALPRLSHSICPVCRTAARAGR